MRIKVPPTSIVADTITVGGYKFFYRPTSGNSSLQCATCLSLMGIVGSQKVKPGEVRKIFIVKDCDCPKQK